MAMCPQHRGLFGITVDEICHNQYSFVWSFKLDERRAKSEGFEQQSVNGSVVMEPDFPGCPYCGAKTFVFCGKCGAISCYDGHGTSKCPKCGFVSRVEVADSFNIKEEVINSNQQLNCCNLK